MVLEDLGVALEFVSVTVRDLVSVGAWVAWAAWVVWVVRVVQGCAIGRNV